MDPRFGGASGFSRHTSPSSELATRFYSGGYNEAGNLYAETRTIGVMSEGDINQREADIEGLNRVFSEYMEEWDAINETLADWLSRHPTFAKEFGFVDEGRDKPRIDNYRLEELFTGGGPQIESESQFLVAWGYKEGIARVASALDGNTNVPHQGYGQEE